MSTLAEKESKIIDSISELLDALDITLAQMADPSNKAVGYDAESRAVAQLETILKEEEKLTSLYERGEAEKVAGKQADLCRKLSRELDKIEARLGTLGESDGKLKKFMTQKKATLENYQRIAGCPL